MRTVDEKKRSHTVPVINVTPLIDVLLVLLIIFMVASPLKPGRFKTQLPQPPDNSLHVEPNPTTLVVTIDKDLRLKLNRLDEDMGTVDDTAKLSAKLATLFAERANNRVFRDGMEARGDLPLDERVLKTVFIKAPRSISYGQVVKVIDGIKGAGANPVGLQLDALN